MAKKKLVTLFNEAGSKAEVLPQSVAALERNGWSVEEKVPREDVSPFTEDHDLTDMETLSEEENTRPEEQA